MTSKWHKTVEVQITALWQSGQWTVLCKAQEICLSNFTGLIFCAIVSKKFLPRPISWSLFAICKYFNSYRVSSLMLKFLINLLSSLGHNEWRFSFIFLNQFSLRQGYPLTTPFQYSSWSLLWSNKVREGNKMSTNRKRSQCISTWRSYNTL